MTKLIYLDNAAATPLDPRVAECMMGYLTPGGVFGNPSSTHRFGLEAKAAIEEARAQVAALIAADPAEIIWTSGATESDNLALKGAAELYQRKGKHIITMKTEHPAVLDSCQQLEKMGFSVTYLAPESSGLLDLDALTKAISNDTILVSIMHVNNETGIIQDIAAIGQITRERDILFHVDAAQSAGKIPIDVNAAQVDLLALSAHKVYGPKGMGALYIRRKPRVRVAPQMQGGGHEHGMRSGTLPTHQIVGMGEAFALAKREMAADYEKIARLKTLFWQELQNITSVSLNGDWLHSVPHILNVRFHLFRADLLLQLLPELAMSMGSACHSKGVEPSYVLRALGLTALEAHSALRFSFGRFTTEEDIRYALERIKSVVEKQI